jgi:hypothetical protein
MDARIEAELPSGDDAAKLKIRTSRQEAPEESVRLCEGGFPPRETKPREAGQPKKGR